VLEIRRGNSSNGELLDWGPPRDYFEAAGVYIRLRMRCSPYRSFRAVFAWIQSASDLTSSSATCGFIVCLTEKNTVFVFE
jgi:hypothetical protein